MPDGFKENKETRKQPQIATNQIIISEMKFFNIF